MIAPNLAPPHWLLTAARTADRLLLNRWLQAALFVGTALFFWIGSGSVAS